MNHELLSLAARALVDESAIDMTTADGRELEVWTISSDGPALRGSAPRLEVREGMRMECRLIIDGMPHRITVEVEQAEIQSQSRAALSLAIVDVAVDGQRRRSERLDVSVAANLTAMICDRLVPGEHLSGMLSDISEGGVAVSVPDLRPRDGDRLRMRARIFEGTIDCELRIVSVRPGDSGTQLLGCVFLEPSAETSRAVSALLVRLAAGQPATATGDGVRASLGIEDEPEAPGRAAAYRPASPPLNRGLASA